MISISLSYDPARARRSSVLPGGWREAGEGRVGAPCCRSWDLLIQLQLYWETIPLWWHSWRETTSCSCLAIMTQAKRAIASLMHHLKKPLPFFFSLVKTKTKIKVLLQAPKHACIYLVIYLVSSRYQALVHRNKICNMWSLIILAC